MKYSYVGVIVLLALLLTCIPVQAQEVEPEWVPSPELVREFNSAVDCLKVVVIGIGSVIIMMLVFTTRSSGRRKYNRDKKAAYRGQDRNLPML